MLSVSIIGLTQKTQFGGEYSPTDAPGLLSVLAGSAIVDLVLLGFFAVFTYLAAYLVWLRSSIAD